MFRLFFDPLYIINRVKDIRKQDAYTPPTSYVNAINVVRQSSNPLIAITLSKEVDKSEWVLLRNLLPLIAESMGHLEDPNSGPMPKFINALGLSHQQTPTLLRHLESTMLDGSQNTTFQFIFVCAIYYTPTIRDRVRDISDPTKFQYLINLLAITLDITRAGCIFEKLNSHNTFNIMATVMTRIKSNYMTEVRICSQFELDQREKELNEMISQRNGQHTRRL